MRIVLTGIALIGTAAIGATLMRIALIGAVVSTGASVGTWRWVRRETVSRPDFAALPTGTPSIRRTLSRLFRRRDKQNKEPGYVAYAAQAPYRRKTSEDDIADGVEHAHRRLLLSANRGKADDGRDMPVGIGE
jgi:hypothetical protein